MHCLMGDDVHEVRVEGLLRLRAPPLARRSPASPLFSFWPLLLSSSLVLPMLFVKPDLEEAHWLIRLTSRMNIMGFFSSFSR